MIKRKSSPKISTQASRMVAKEMVHRELASVGALLNGVIRKAKKQGLEVFISYKGQTDSVFISVSEKVSP